MSDSRYRKVEAMEAMEVIMEAMEARIVVEGVKFDITII